MDYSEKSRIEKVLMDELKHVKTELENSLTLKEKILGVQYPIKNEGYKISMLYSTRKSRRENHGIPFVGYITLEEDDKLSLNGIVGHDDSASKLFERSVHRVAHRFNVPLYLNLSR